MDTAPSLAKITESHRTRFHRQRRDLILVSALLFLYKFLALEVKGLIVQSTGVSVNEPDRIPLVLTVVLLYLLWRYYQVFVLMKNDRRNLRRDVFHECLMRSAERLLKGRLPHLRNDSAEEWKDAEFKANGIQQEEPYYAVTVEFKGTRRASPSRPWEEGSSSSENYRIPRHLVGLCQAQTSFHRTIHTLVFTDYHLPYLLALFAAWFYWNEDLLIWIVRVAVLVTLKLDCN